MVMRKETPRFCERMNQNETFHNHLQGYFCRKFTISIRHGPEVPYIVFVAVYFETHGYLKKAPFISLEMNEMDIGCWGGQFQI